MSKRTEFIVYLVGVALLGLGYSSLKQALSGPMLLFAVLAYLVAVRLFGRWLANRLDQAKRKDG